MTQLYVAIFFIMNGMFLMGYALEEYTAPTVIACLFILACFVANIITGSVITLIFASVVVWPFLIGDTVKNLVNRRRNNKL